MKSFKYLVFVFILFIFIGQLFSQTVDDYYHGAANLYVNNQKQRAKNEIRKGLEIAPNDPKLNTLQGLIKEEEDQQQQQQQQQDKEQQQGEEKEDNQGQSEEQNQEQQQQEEQQAQQVEENDEQQMSKEDAERILEALKNDEQDNKKLRKPLKGGRRSVAKDW